MASYTLAKSINAPVLIRALADVMNEHPHVLHALDWRYEKDLLELNTKKGPQFPLAHVSLSAAIDLREPQLRLAMGAAYKRHGGDPAAFLQPFELELLHDHHACSSLKP